jgi:hypothetical protein
MSRYIGQSTFGIADELAMLEIFDNLTGEAKDYVDRVVNEIATSGIPNFGEDSARRLLARCLVKGYFVPRVWKGK